MEAGVRALAAALIFLTMSSSAIADDVEVRTFGIGRQSCASWLMDFQSEQEGSAWILGYWSGINYSDAMAGRRAVGESTDGPGVLGEMKKRCRERPAENMQSELINLFIELRAKGK
jgi:hypothetical protein